MPERGGYASLRRGRWSQEGAQYFVTCCTRDRSCGLHETALAAAIASTWGQLESEGVWQVRTGTVMPDHIHLLLRLGAASLSEAVRLMKGRLASVLRQHNLRWEPGFYEHRLRPDEVLHPIFLYIYLNPYRAGLLSSADLWPGYFCNAEDWHWFGFLTQNVRPYPEWLGGSVGA